VRGGIQLSYRCFYSRFIALAVRRDPVPAVALKWRFFLQFPA
jgi:hypothetical protein